MQHTTTELQTKTKNDKQTKKQTMRSFASSSVYSHFDSFPYIQRLTPIVQHIRADSRPRVFDMSATADDVHPTTPCRDQGHCSPDSTAKRARSADESSSVDDCIGTCLRTQWSIGDNVIPLFTADGKRVFDNTVTDVDLFFKVDLWLVRATGAGIYPKSVLKKTAITELGTYLQIKQHHSQARGKHTRTCWIVDGERQPISGGLIQVKVSENTTLQMQSQSKAMYIKFVPRTFEWVVDGIKADLGNHIAFDGGNVQEVAEADAADDGSSDDGDDTDQVSSAATSPLFSADEISALSKEQIRYWDSKRALKAIYKGPDGSKTTSALYTIRVKCNKNARRMRPPHSSSQRGTAPSRRQGRTRPRGWTRPMRTTTHMMSESDFCRVKANLGSAHGVVGARRKGVRHA